MCGTLPRRGVRTFRTIQRGTVIRSLASALLLVALALAACSPAGSPPPAADQPPAQPWPAAPQSEPTEPAAPQPEAAEPAAPEAAPPEPTTPEPLPATPDSGAPAAAPEPKTPEPLPATPYPAAPEAAAPAAAEPTPAPTPEPTPVPLADPQTLEQIDRLLQRGVERGDFAGGVALALVQGQVVKQAAYGHSYAYQAPSQPAEHPIAMQTDTVFDIASLTKLFTAVAVMQLVEQGHLDLDEPAARYLPEAMTGEKADITIRQLLTHTSGLRPGPSYRQMEPGDADAILREVAMERPPGTGYTYSDLGYLALGRLVEGSTGMGLDEYVRRSIVEPLGLTQTGFGPDPDRPEQEIPCCPQALVAATEYITEPVVGQSGLIWGTVHDPLAHSVGGAAGHAGVFSTAEDVARFGQMMLESSAGQGETLLSPATVAAMTSAETRGSGGTVGLGWQLDQSWYMGGLSSPTTFGHTGFTGTSLLVDPEHQAVVVLLTNRLHPTPAAQGINPYRQGVANAVAEALGLPGR